MKTVSVFVCWLYVNDTEERMMAYKILEKTYYDRLRRAKLERNKYNNNNNDNVVTEQSTFIVIKSKSVNCVD